MGRRERPAREWEVHSLRAGDGNGEGQRNGHQESESTVPVPAPAPQCEGRGHVLMKSSQVLIRRSSRAKE